MDLETGAVKVPTRSPLEPSKLVYNLKPSVTDYEAFTKTLANREALLWDRENVRLHSDLFYHSYFRDYQQISDLRQKAQARIQSFIVRVTRQDPKSDTSSSQANKGRLETKFRSAMNLMYEAFEEAFTLEHPELIGELRDHLIKPTIAQI